MIVDMSMEPQSLPVVRRGEQDGRRHVLDLTLAELRRWLVEAGQPRYRAEQIVEWVYGRQAQSFDEMTNLPKDLRAWLGENAILYTSTVARERVAEDGTRKLLLTMADGAAVETVWIPEEGRHTACLSSQVGCPVGCAFCASGIAGAERDLTTGEVVEQALRVSRMVAEHAPAGEGKRARLSNIVMMGMGEPLANYDAVLAALRTINASWGLNIGARKITLSTVGLPKQIKQLAEENLQINLALSLHATEEELRRELIPWGKVPLEALLSACEYYFEETGREVTLEYVLLAGVNDRPRHAVALAKIARRLRANINLLRYNPVPGLPFERPKAQEAAKFQQLVRDRGGNAHLRRSRGAEIDAACGQLRRGSLAEGEDVSRTQPV